MGYASSGVGVVVKEGERSIYNLLTKTAPFREVVRQTSNELLDVLPASKDLAGAEVEFVNIQGREKVLKEALSTIKNMYNFIIIDCPPSLSLLTINALVAADSVITPIQCEYYAMEGLAHFINTTTHHRKDRISATSLRSLLPISLSAHGSIPIRKLLTATKSILSMKTVMLHSAVPKSALQRQTRSSRNSSCR